MSTFQIQKTDHTFFLSGYLDENADLSPLKGATGQIRIDFGGVKRVNSCGVRDWVNLLATFDPSSELSYENCSMVVVKQLNAVPDFLGKALVKNFEAPYYCEECDEEAVINIQTDQIQGEVPPTIQCPQCKNDMNFDAIPKQFFDFIKRASGKAA